MRACPQEYMLMCVHVDILRLSTQQEIQQPLQLQRRHNKRHAGVCNQRRQLVAQRLAAAAWHEAQHVATLLKRSAGKPWLMRDCACMRMGARDCARERMTGHSNAVNSLWRQCMAPARGDA
eukprot:357381-Chlamydomonas_euryale.AAC.2